jgi:serine/threonine-protein phosphatase 6 regulatory subunit 3
MSLCLESIVTSCLESNNKELIDHLFEECKFLDKLLAADENPYAPDSHAEVGGWTRCIIVSLNL